MRLTLATVRSMRSAAADVEDYIAQQDVHWRDALETLRTLCLATLIDHTEGMDYGMPSYSRDGKTNVSFAKQANYLSLYLMKKPVLDDHRAQLAGVSVGKGCIRYTTTKQIDWDVVKEILVDAATSDADPC